MRSASLLSLQCALAVLAALALSPAALAQDCSTKNGPEEANCRREQAAAKQEARRGHLDDGNVDYHKNALARCQPLSGSDREDCVRRVEGGGVSSGSVESGGIYRETRTVIPDSAVVPSAQPTRPNASAPPGR